MADTLIYVVAGEASGDLIGARLIESLKAENPNLRFAGVGGDKMYKMGLKSLFPFHELSIMGFWEIVPHIPKLLGRIRQTFQDVRKRKPAAVITIDSPGFNFRLAKALREHPETRDIPRIHYVAPSVWAYKPERAAKCAKLFHHLLVLLPFEPPYFQKEGLACSWVGHPAIWEWKTPGDGKAFRERHGMDKHTRLLGMLPGSRKGEIERHLPIFREALTRIQKRYPDTKAMIVAGAHIRAQIERGIESWPEKPLLIDEQTEKKDAFSACDVALAKSGTVTLELALARVPMVIAYKTSAYSAWMIRRMATIRFVNLVNLVLDREVIPELLQEQCTPELLADRVLALMNDASVCEQQLQEVVMGLKALGADEPESPSDKAAQVVLKMLSPKPA